MTYIDAGYISALSVLFVYAVVLVGRRRRLERTARAPRPRSAASGARPSTP